MGKRGSGGGRERGAHALLNSTRIASLVVIEGFILSAFSQTRLTVSHSLTNWRKKIERRKRVDAINIFNGFRAGLRQR
jgi:hypothetical protein